MSEGIVVAILAATQAMTVAAIAGLFNREARHRKADQARVEKRAAVRARESHLSMAMMSANTGLAMATARVVKENGKTSDELVVATAAAQKAQKEYYDFINSVATEHIAAE